MPRGGQWNLVRKLLADARPLDNWVVVNFIPDLRNEQVVNFVGSLVKACNTLGMSLLQVFCSEHLFHTL